jgi:ATP-dependent RNA helicase DDX27
VLRPFRYIFFG